MNNDDNGRNLNGAIRETQRRSILPLRFLDVASKLEETLREG